MKLYPILALALLAALAAIIAAALAEGRQNIPSILLGLAIGVLLLVPAFVIVRRQNRA